MIALGRKISLSLSGFAARNTQIVAQVDKSGTGDVLSCGNETSLRPPFPNAQRSVTVAAPLTKSNVMRLAARATHEKMPSRWHHDGQTKTPPDFFNPDVDSCVDDLCVRDHGRMG